VTDTVPADTRSGGEPLLRAAGLTVTYGLVAAVDAVDLEVGPNEVVALLGANGAGKTSS